MSLSKPTNPSIHWWLCSFNYPLYLKVLLYSWTTLIFNLSAFLYRITQLQWHPYPCLFASEAVFTPTFYLQKEKLSLLLPIILSVSDFNPISSLHLWVIIAHNFSLLFFFQLNVLVLILCYVSFPFNIHSFSLSVFLTKIHTVH